jgi:hypothetical protein
MLYIVSPYGFFPGVVNRIVHSPCFTTMADSKSLNSFFRSEDKEAFCDEVVAGVHAENVGGAPVEVNSPLGRQVGSFTVTTVNISMMIGTGICKSLWPFYLTMSVS